jgi:hypothetical protein
MYEVVQSSSTTADDVVVRPLSSGSPIGDWTLTINPADYGALTDPFNITIAVGNLQARGVTFTLNDFTGTGTLSGVTGLRFTDPNTTWDPVSVGVVIVPEPAGFPLAGLGIGLAAWAARRRRSKA